MNNFPNFAQYHYQVEKELGHNRAGGRATYLATDTRTQQQIVIKQFQFAKSQSWSDYDSYEREIQVLRELNHSGIPRYLNSVQTEDGFCMIQEYKRADSLAVPRSFDPDEVRQIAIAALEILVYLQARIPPVIHRDIKPGNLLVDDARQVYLVDFGFARVGEGEVGVSSVVKGTLGFMPPEQLFNRQLSAASDLYGLGMTLICLLTGTKADRIGELVDISYKVSFKHLVPRLNQQWIQWLEKMVEPKMKDRFPHALAALAAVPTSSIRPPEAHLSQSTLVLNVERLGDVLTQTVSLTNPIPDTTLSGHWEMAPHPQDPHPNLYQWVTVEPTTFTGNSVNFQITIETSRLLAGKLYSRKLLLHTNTSTTTCALSLQVQTGQIPGSSLMRSHRLLALLGLTCLGLGWSTGWGVQRLGIATSPVEFGTILGGAIGLEGAAWLMRSSGWRVGATSSTFAATVLGGTMLLHALSSNIATVIGSAVVFGAGLGGVSGALGGLATGTTIEKLLVEREQKQFVIVFSMLTAALGMSSGLSLSFNFANSGLLMLAGVNSLALTVLLAYHQLRRAKTVFTHRKSEKLLIKP
ncbi:MAG: serine/threonine protein kinase [Myxacorys californica WJT36-NPBG1]|jgi:serine/threonine protein kinase|nr:serine/threonine protein kinase [Myxacorys californica WJT36-NPBG1]